MIYRARAEITVEAPAKGLWSPVRVEVEEVGKVEVENVVERVDEEKRTVTIRS